MSFTSILLQATTTAAPAADSAAKGGGNGGMIQMLLLVGMLGVFYFFLIAPQRKKQKEQGKFVEDIKKGDKVATIGGIVGKVLELRTKTFIIETEGGGRLQLLRSAISFENTRALNAEDKEKDKESKEDKKA
jgi:preprotein translocase subunit YajC